jgi:hypothetical protein
VTMNRILIAWSLWRFLVGLLASNGEVMFCKSLNGKCQTKIIYAHIGRISMYRILG